MKQVKKFLVDVITNVVFWHPLLAFVEFFIFRLSVSELLSARFGNFLFALLMGGVYGRAIDAGRYIFNREYYEETNHQKNRSKRNWKTEVYDAGVDIFTTSIYWGIIMFFWLYYVTQLPLTTVISLLGAYTIVYIFASGFYGKVLNWSRKKFV